MGFQNLAFLAKHVWRLIHEPTALWAQVLKEQYFHNSSFLEAKNGGYALWVWPSLLNGRDLILKRAHWQILNRAQVYIWRDQWIPGLTHGHPNLLDGATFGRDHAMSSIINHELRVW